MAKSQLRGNREAKKPKQPKKPVMPASPLGGSSPKSSPQTSDFKKK
jgi:hypothetical protein